jgi:hypothetical protein
VDVFFCFMFGFVHFAKNKQLGYETEIFFCLHIITLIHFNLVETRQKTWTFSWEVNNFLNVCMQFCKCFTVDSVYLKKIKNIVSRLFFGLVIFVSYVELLYRLASDLALKTKYYSTLFSIRNRSEIAFFF